jgi:hypothetical protein
MRNGQLDNVLRHVRRLVAARQTRELPDRELLQRFVGARDEAAFAAIMERHGRLVMGVCQRILHDAHHAEDAYASLPAKEGITVNCIAPALWRW